METVRLQFDDALPSGEDFVFVSRSADDTFSFTLHADVKRAQMGGSERIECGGPYSNEDDAITAAVDIAKQRGIKTLYVLPEAPPERVGLS